MKKSMAMFLNLNCAACHHNDNNESPCEFSTFYRCVEKKVLAQPKEIADLKAQLAERDCPHFDKTKNKCMMYPNKGEQITLQADLKAQLATMKSEYKKQWDNFNQNSKGLSAQLKSAREALEKVLCKIRHEIEGCREQPGTRMRLRDDRIVAVINAALEGGE